MADAIQGHRRIVGKPMPSAFNTTATASILMAATDLTSATLVKGLVQHDYVDPDLQVTILATIDETGSAALGDILAALKGQPKPAGAVFATVSTGTIQCENGIVDASSRLSRMRLGHVGADRDAGEGGPLFPLWGDEDTGSGFSDTDPLIRPMCARSVSRRYMSLRCFPFQVSIVRASATSLARPPRHLCRHLG